jgi:hypothetical protein
MAGEPNVKLARSATIGGRTIGGVDELIPANEQQVYEETVPTGTTDREVDFATTVSTNLVQALHSTQAITVVSNIPSTSTATTAHQTIAVAKNVAQIWTTNEPTAGRVFTVDVVKLYITNSSGSDAKVQIGFASDETP